MTTPPPTVTTVADPLFTTAEGPASLFDLFARITAGASFELPRMAAHQRVPVVTAFAILMAVLRRYSVTPLQTASDWEQAWRGQIGPDALRLVGPETAVAFCQPPLTSGGARSAMSLSDLDLTFAKLAHAIKPIASGTAEDAVFALLGGTWKSSALKWVGGSRYGLAAVLASDDGTLAGEVRHLLIAYEAAPSATLGRNAVASRAADHLLWLRPVAQHALDPDRLPWPYLDARPCHLTEPEPGVFTGLGQHSTPRRLAGNSHADDPHVPLCEGRPYRLSEQRPWSLDAIHEMLFGSPRTIRPLALSLSGYRCVRVCAVTTRQATTLGYREVLYPLAPQAAVCLFATPDRAADVSARALQAAATVSGAVAVAASLLVSGGKRSATVVAASTAAKVQFYTAVGELLTRTVLNLLAGPADPVAEQEALNACVIFAAWAVWERLTSGSHRPLDMAKGTRYLARKFSRLNGGQPTIETLALAQQCGAVLGAMNAHLTPAQRAKLRTMTPGRPAMAYYSALATVPERLRDAPIWAVLIPALGRVRLTAYPPGRALAETGYPELRMARLLSATGDALVAQIATLMAWLRSRNVEAVDLSMLAALGTADHLGDTDTRQQLRSRLALSYVSVAQRVAA